MLYRTVELEAKYYDAKWLVVVKEGYATIASENGDIRITFGYLWIFLRKTKV